jgi:hypothetical protein
LQIPFTQVPPLQEVAFLQLVPHKVLSELRSTQEPPQLVCPDGHSQVPFTQDVPPVQTWPEFGGHPPQWLLSVLVLVQVPLQLVGIAAGQAQAPFWQVIPPVQVLPHDPQLPVVLRLTHVQ